jgi:predicted metal-binding integral membrane protein DUF2182
VPVVRLFTVVTARAPDPARARLAFLAGYLAVWTAFAALALIVDEAVHALVAAWPWLAARPGLLLGTTLVLAGSFQFSPLKDACLTACRNPVGFLWQHYRRGAAGGWRLGARHGLSCLGCCWALMVVMLGDGCRQPRLDGGAHGRDGGREDGSPGSAAGGPGRGRPARGGRIVVAVRPAQLVMSLCWNRQIAAAPSTRA